MISSGAFLHEREKYDRIKHVVCKSQMRTARKNKRFKVIE